jgi:membrane-associated phospholipid phosphatase
VDASTQRSRRGWVGELDELDRAVYAAVARTPTPALDRAMRRLSQAADLSRLNMLGAAILSVAGGRAGRRAARIGLLSVGATAAVVNVAVKPVARRRRPDREGHAVPLARQVPMPRTRSLPSGHSASAFAFATGVGHVMPHVAPAFRVVALAIAYSRVHTGVHYPGDVVAGALLGTAVAQGTAYVVDRA